MPLQGPRVANAEQVAGKAAVEKVQPGAFADPLAVACEVRRKRGGEKADLKRVEPASDRLLGDADVVGQSREIQLLSRAGGRQADKAVSEISASARLVAAPGSVAEVAGCARIVETAVAGLGGLDILINNAGWGDVTLLGETTEESWDRTVD